MILFLCVLWISIMYYLGYNKFGKGDTFSPFKLITIKLIIIDLPFLWYMLFYPESFNQEVLAVCRIDLESAILYYTFVKTLAYICIYFGIKFSNKLRGIGKIKILQQSLSEKQSLVVGMISLIIGLYYYYSFVNEAGGLFYLVNNLNKRTELLNEIEGASQAVNFITLSCIMLLYNYSRKKSYYKLFLIILLIALTVVVFSTLGGRKNVLYLLILILAVVNYYILPLTIKSIKKIYLILGTSFLIFYILIIPIFRTNDGFNKIVNGQVDIVKIIELEDLVNSLSYTYIEVFAVNYFDINNIWMFSSTNDILINVFNKGENKETLPPIDDGVYFRTIVNNQAYILPPKARGAMYPSSWPIENIGFAYANFWLFGVVIFFFLIGIVYNYFYRLFLTNKMHPIFMYLYVFVVFNFNFSNLRIVQFLSFLPLIIMLIILFEIFKNKKNN